jgi:hypothetical protein
LLTCQNEENGERKTQKESDEGKKKKGEILNQWSKKNYTELKFKIKIYIN